jgi:predicted amidophosphoribosyltransferase
VATARELTDPYLSTYVPPPKAGPGVCEVCHTATGGDPPYRRCWSCLETCKLVTRPIELVVPISLTRTDMDAQLYNVLRDYKSELVPESVRAQHRAQMAALLLRFLARHRDCIKRAAGVDYDTITVVPSKRGRVGPHPLEQVIALAPDLAATYERLLEPGPGEIGRNAPADDGFVAAEAARGRRVLLVDDTMTSGSKLQSAASALTLRGARVIAAVVLGRVIDVSDPDRYPEKLELWERQRRLGFDFDTCCLE